MKSVNRSVFHVASPVALAVLLALSVSACGESTSATAGPDNDYQPTSPDPQPGEGAEFEQQALVNHLAEQVITPTYQQFLSLSRAQTAAAEQFCLAQADFNNGQLSAEQLDGERSAAQISWRDAMAIWQQTEVMQIGPLPFDNSNLRNKIYSWPLVNTCHVDLDVAFFNQGEVNGGPYNIALRTPSRKGLAAMEYLLFNASSEHSCTSVEPEGWANLTNAERSLARCRFAIEVAQDITRNAEALVDLWNDYLPNLIQAGAEGSEFDDAHQAVNAISDAMFYLDTFTKDGKLAQPLGLMSNPCGAEACPESVESGLSGNSLSNINNNLISFKKLFTGDGTGPGFLDYLVEVGDPQTADTMRADIDAAISNTQAYQITLGEALQTSPEQVEQTHADVKKVTDKLKTDFITSLSLELPQTAAGDND